MTFFWSNFNTCHYKTLSGSSRLCEITLPQIAWHKSIFGSFSSLPTAQRSLPTLSLHNLHSHQGRFEFIYSLYMFIFTPCLTEPGGDFQESCHPVKPLHGWRCWSPILRQGLLRSALQVKKRAQSTVPSGSPESLVLQQEGRAQPRLRGS